MAFSGSVSKSLSASRALSGQIDLDGVLGDSYKTKRSLSGALAFSGVLAGEIPGVTQVLLYGSLAFSGLLSDINSFSRSISGVLGFAAGVVTAKLNGVSVVSGWLSRVVRACVKKCVYPCVYPVDSYPQGKEE